MTRRLLLMVLVATLLIGAGTLPAATASGGNAAAGPMVVYADDSEPLPTPTATPLSPDGSCQGSSHCGG